MIEVLIVMDSGLKCAPERIRTSDPQIRSLILYPTELQAPITKESEASIALRTQQILSYSFGL